MTLADIRDNAEDPSNAEKFIILHEFGHAIGLLHEHQAPAKSLFLVFRSFSKSVYHLQNDNGLNK